MGPPRYRTPHLDLLLLIPQVPAPEVACRDPTCYNRNCDDNGEDDPSVMSRNPVRCKLAHVLDGKEERGETNHDLFWGVFEPFPDFVGVDVGAEVVLEG